MRLTGDKPHSTKQDETRQCIKRGDIVAARKDGEKYLRLAGVNCAQESIVELIMQRCSHLPTAENGKLLRGHFHQRAYKASPPREAVIIISLPGYA